MAYEPTVWEDGQVITAEKLNKLEQGVQNEQIGPAGKDGAAATVAIGSVTTGNAGTDAQVTNSGTANAAILDFVIPKGETGATGTTPGNATVTKAGIVKQMEAIADLSAAPTQQDFNNLLAKLRTAGILGS